MSTGRQQLVDIIHTQEENIMHALMVIGRLKIEIDALDDIEADHVWIGYDNECMQNEWVDEQKAKARLRNADGMK